MNTILCCRYHCLKNDWNMKHFITYYYYCHIIIFLSISISFIFFFVSILYFPVNKKISLSVNLPPLARLWRIIYILLFLCHSKGSKIQPLFCLNVLLFSQDHLHGLYHFDPLKINYIYNYWKWVAVIVRNDIFHIWISIFMYARYRMCLRVYICIFLWIHSCVFF